MRTRKKALSVFLAVVLAVPALAAFPSNGAKVKAENVFRPEDYGTHKAVVNDGKDDREAIKAAADAAGEAGGGIVEFSPGQYDIDIFDFGGTGIGIYVDKPGVTFRLSEGTALNVLPTHFGEFCAIHVKADNFKISGGRIVGEKSSHKGSSDADGHGIGVFDSRNIEISDMTITDNWGDGIYLGSSSSDGTYGGSGNIKITNCKVQNNRRNNISIVDVDHVTIDKCTITGAGGSSPCSGIQIEANTDNGKVPKSAVCSAIEIKNTTIKAKKKHQKNGKYFALNILNPYYQSNNKPVAKNVKITNCKITGDTGNYSGKKVTFKKTKIKGIFYDHMNTKLKKCTVKKIYKF